MKINPAKPASTFEKQFQYFLIKKHEIRVGQRIKNRKTYFSVGTHFAMLFLKTSEKV